MQEGDAGKIIFEILGSWCMVCYPYRLSILRSRFNKITGEERIIAHCKARIYAIPSVSETLFPIRSYRDIESLSISGHYQSEVYGPVRV